jgi:hypothetical protein
VRTSMDRVCMFNPPFELCLHTAYERLGT